jgi:hypothetical protein
MVRTGARAAVLSDLLGNAGLRPTTPPAAPGLESLPADAGAELLDRYRELGGIQPSPRLRTGGWDLAVEDEPGEMIVIELDEELHFNRYRRVTLSAPWYHELAWVSDYATLCNGHEERCRTAGTWGKRWTTPSSERLFGPAGTPGELDGPGAPRWKQRALYDSLKDLAARSGCVPQLARLSIYDPINGMNLEQCLNGSAVADPAVLRDLIERRIVGV